MNWGTRILLAGLLAVTNTAFAGDTTDEAAASIARGRHLTLIAGCNDCHTDGFAQSAGLIEESAWLKGSVVGWKGPWGTTYPINLRRFMQRLEEDQWVTFARTRQSRPPMPWFALRDMHEQELRDLYRYIRSLEVTGEEAPAYLPPGEKPPMPYVEFVAPEPPKSEKP